MGSGLTGAVVQPPVPAEFFQHPSGACRGGPAGLSVLATAVLPPPDLLEQNLH